MVLNIIKELCLYIKGIRTITSMNKHCIFEWKIYLRQNFMAIPLQSNVAGVYI